MGSHAYARLGYGYDLGDTDSGDGLFDDIEALTWYDEDLGLEESAEKVLLAAVGFTEDDYMVDGYFERRRDALKKFGSIHFQHYGNSISGYTGALLFVGQSLSINWVQEIELPVITDEHREQLKWALKVLGLDPDRTEQPGWLLATHYG
jgi:hypothetical protein